jgi:hypothetical protein
LAKSVSLAAEDCYYLWSSYSTHTCSDYCFISNIRQTAYSANNVQNGEQNSSVEREKSSSQILRPCFVFRLSTLIPQTFRYCDSRSEEDYDEASFTDLNCSHSVLAECLLWSWSKLFISRHLNEQFTAADWAVSTLVADRDV